MNRHYWIKTALLSLALQSFVSTAVLAQDDEVEEIVVLGLAERYGSGLSRAEFVIGAEDIGLRPVGAEITQALVKIPGVQVGTGDARGGSFSLELYMRGLNDQQIGLSVDGIPGGDARFNGGSPPNRYVDSSNVGTIRVSQSSGEIGAPSRSALGGFIGFETIAPDDEFGAEFEFATGNFDYRRMFLKVDTGEIFGGMTSYWSFSDQSNDIHTGPNSRSKNRQHFDAKIQKDFSSGSSVDFRLSYNELKDNDFGIVSLGDYLNNPTSDTVNDIFAGDPDVDSGFTGFGGALGGEREDLLAYFNIDLVLSDTVNLSVNPYVHTLDGESFAYQGDSTTTVSGDPRDQNTIEEDFDVDGNRVADMRVTPRDRDRSGVTAELAFDDVAGFNDIRVGVWIESDETNENRNFFRVNDVRTGIEYSKNSLGYIEYERKLTTDTLYYYFQDKISLLDERLTLDVGGTFHDIDYKWQSPIEFAGANKLNAKTDDIDIKLGGVYSFTDSFEAFVGYSENFGGIFEDAFLGSSNAIDPRTVQPETSKNTDLGIRYVTDTLALSIQWYQIDFENRLTSVPTMIDPGDIDDVINGNSPTQVVNQGGVDSQGFEVTGSAILGNVNIYATYSNQQSEWTQSDPTQGIISGNSVQDIPDDSFFTEIQWSPNENFSVALNAKYVSDRVGGNIFVPDFCNPFFCFDETGAGVDGLDFLGTQEIDGYWLAGLTAAYDLPDIAGVNNLRVQLNIDNLFDEEFIGSVTGATTSLPEFGVIGGLTAESALDRYFIGFPRTVTLSVSASF
jgi:iron complex outermembrane receptor protein